jgi:hypothetical protein
MFINSSACIIFLIFANIYQFDPEIDLFVLILIIISFFQFMASLIFFHKSNPVENPKLDSFVPRDLFEIKSDSGMSFLSEARTKNLVGICAMVRKEKKQLSIGQRRFLVTSFLRMTVLILFTKPSKLNNPEMS